MRVDEFLQSACSDILGLFILSVNTELALGPMSQVRYEPPPVQLVERAPLPACLPACLFFIVRCARYSRAACCGLRAAGY